MTPYAEIRSSIKSGDLMLGQSDHWKARLVRWWTGSPYSHVGVLWVIAGRVFVLEAVLAGVRIYPLSNERHWWLARTPAVMGAQAEQFALRRIGEAYSQVWAVAAGLGFRLPTGDGQWECAEYARQVLLQCRMPAAALRLLANIPETPRAVAEWAATCGGEIIEVDNA